MHDFALVPPTTKENYLRAYSLAELSWAGTIARPNVFTVTSGSTGEPFYFPRSENIDRQSAVFHKLFLDYRSAHKHESTLVVVCFGMGAWIGGLITYQAFHTIATEANYPLSIITPGPNKNEVFETIKRIAPKFKHVILCGYPPFLKDVIDEGEAHGINWHRLSLRIIFAAEAFSEEFRAYVAQIAGIREPHLDTMNIYGSADIGTMAEETPASIVLRQAALRNKTLYGRLFEVAHRLPTLAQFHPGFVNFESVNGQILVSGNNVLPLVRYAIGDYGGVMGFGEATAIVDEAGVSLKALSRRGGLARSIPELPFVYVYERADLSTKLYGAIIYPEHIKHGTYHRKLAKYLTGKFTMFTKLDARQNQYLEINVEMKPGVKVTAALEKQAAEIISRTLLERNAEHRNNATFMPGRVDPKIVFWKHEHPEHFRVGGKQQWVKNRA